MVSQDARARPVAQSATWVTSGNSRSFLHPNRRCIKAADSSPLAACRRLGLPPQVPAKSYLAQVLPDVPTIGESVPGYVGGGWSGIGAPAHTPTEIVDLLNREVNAALADPKIKERLENLGSPILMMSPAEFRKLITEETERWAKVIKFANIRPE